MAPVDGGLTLPLPKMIALLKHVRSAIVIPMHWFSRGSLQGFIAGMEGQFRVDVRDEPSIDVSLRGLPRQPTRSIVCWRSSFCWALAMRTPNSPRFRYSSSEIQLAKTTSPQLLSRA
jgi:hypothetical protein